MAVSKLTFAKFLELVLSVTCLILHYKSQGESGQERPLLIAATFGGFSIILIVVALGNLLGTPLNKRLDLFLSIVGCALFIICGIFIIEEWKDATVSKFLDTDTRKIALAKGGLAIANGIIFLGDIVFTFRD